MIIKKCLTCEKEIKIPECLSNRKKFCSVKCRGMFYRGHSFSPETQIKKGQRLSPNTEFSKGNYGDKSVNWKGGRRYNGQGYVLIYCPEHPRATEKPNGKYIREHIIVAEKKIGRFLKYGEVVHHINGIRDDNRPENLVVLKNSSLHTKRFHSTKGKKCQKISEGLRKYWETKKC